jgi:hypothetical protein
MAVHDRVASSRSSAADDEAALDRLIESALAEERALEEAPVSVAISGDAEAFLMQAAAFLQARDDRAALVERLRQLVVPEQDAVQPQPAGTDAETE